MHLNQLLFLMLQGKQERFSSLMENMRQDHAHFRFNIFLADQINEYP